MKNILELAGRHRDKVQKVILLAAAWVGVYGISYISTMFAADYFSYGVVSLFTYIVVYILLKLAVQDLVQITDRKACRRRILFAFCVALFFSVAMVMGYQLRMTMMTEAGVRGKALIVLRGLCLSIAVFPFTNYLFSWIEKIQSAASEEFSGKWRSRNVFLFGALLVFLCWIPVFLAYYPAVMSYDFHRQSIEASKGFIWFNSYQPLAHTWMIWVALQIGKLFESYEIGMAFYSIFQMLIFALACGYSCATAYRLVSKKWIVAVMILFYGIFPYNSVLAVGVTKDVPFAALFLVFICLFVERTYLSDAKKQKVIDVLWVLEGIVMMLFRNNAIYAVAIFTLFYLIWGAKKQRIRILIMCLLLVIGGKAALEGMQIVIGTEGRGSKVEMFSVPLQQFARVGYYHGDSMDSETYALLDKYVNEEIWSYYNPALSDPVKGRVANTTFYTSWEGHLPQMLVDWAKIGLKYPNEYIDAFLILNSGYWFWDDVTWAEVFGSGLEERKGALSTDNCSVSDEIPEGIASVSKLPALEAAIQDIVNGNCFYNWPVFSNLFKTPLYCWGLLLTVIGCFYVRDRRKKLVTLLPLVYLGTMFLGPVVQVRYVLPIIVIMPLMLAVLGSKNEEKIAKEEKKA